MGPELLLKGRGKLFFVIAVVLFYGCNSENNNDESKLYDLNTENGLESFVSLKTKKQFQLFLYSNFLKDSVKEILAGEEINNREEWGIKFYFFKIWKETLQLKYETHLLNGSVKNSIIKAIKLQEYMYDLFYYNSQNYFMGKEGGEIYSYIIDAENKEVYSAHLFLVPNRPVSLFLSKNIKSKSVKQFFINQFKEDYSDIKLVQEDLTLPY